MEDKDGRPDSEPDDLKGDEMEEEALTKEELESQEEAPRPSSTSSPSSNRPVSNAFTKLMAPKPKAPSASTSASPPKPRHSTGGNPFQARAALGAYISRPENYPANIVIYHTPGFVALHDKFPKATVHVLLLPRSPAHSLLHPFDALDDVEFLETVKAEAAKLKKLAAEELRRRIGCFSEKDAKREAILNGQQPKGEEDGDSKDQKEGEATEELPLPLSGRDWDAEIRCGVHAVPSMSHLHIHVYSRDMHSPSLKHRKHYNSFNTDFLVPLEAFPLPPDDPRRRTKEMGYLRKDLLCWRCGTNFGDRFARLKAHLEQEFGAWKKE